jgi:hypothetical protein
MKGGKTQPTPHFNVCVCLRGSVAISYKKDGAKQLIHFGSLQILAHFSGLSGSGDLFFPGFQCTLFDLFYNKGKDSSL